MNIKKRVFAAFLAAAMAVSSFSLSVFADDEPIAPEYPTEPTVIGAYEIGEDMLMGGQELNRDAYYDKTFTNLAPGVYKMAYLMSGVAPTENWQSRLSPVVKGPGQPDRRCWVDFRHLDAVQAAIDEFELSNNIILVAVFNVPEGYDTVNAGAYLEANLGGTLDSIELATGDYDYKYADGYDWAVEKANTNDFNEDSGGLLKVDEDMWTPSTRRADDATLISVTVNGVEAVLNGDEYEVTVPKADKYDVVALPWNSEADAQYDPATGIITVVSENLNFTNEYKLVINVKSDEPEKVDVAGIKLDKASATLNVKDQLQLTATVTPANATDKNVTWKSSNTAVATVTAAGKVTAVAAGTAKITAAAGGKSAECVITVKAAAQIKAPKVSKVTKLKLTKKGKKLTVKFTKGKGSKYTNVVIYRNGKKVKSANVTGKQYKYTAKKKGKYTAKATACIKVGNKVYKAAAAKSKAVKVK